MSYAQYGSVLIPANNLAQLRGAGLYNPVPNLPQTINRGPAYDKALEVYGNSEAYHYNQRNQLTSHIPDPTPTFMVGSTGLLAESDKNKWTRQPFENSLATNQYQSFANKATNLTPNALMSFFFSDENVEYIQNKIVEEVQRIRGRKISPQNVNDLLLIMKAKYEYALSGWLPRSFVHPNVVGPMGTEENPNGLAYNSSSNGCTSLEFQINQLNKSVLQECIKQVLSGIDAYVHYYKDINSLPLPMDRGVYTSMKGSNELQPNIAFESGHNASKTIASYNQRFNII